LSFSEFHGKRILSKHLRNKKVRLRISIVTRLSFKQAIALVLDFIQSFPDSHKGLKKIKKCQNIKTYREVVKQIILEEPGYGTKPKP